MPTMSRLPLLLFTLSAAAPAQPLPQRPFEAVSVAGGGEVVIRRGPVHSVRVVRGDPAALEVLQVERRSLKIRCRPSACLGRAPRVEVTAPLVTALAVHGGGSIHVERGFAPQADLAVSVHGGGRVDATQLSAANVAASVSGGGNVEINARSSIAASVNGGGVIGYYGAPRVATSVNGGGIVRPLGTGRRR